MAYASTKTAGAAMRGPKVVMPEYLERVFDFLFGQCGFCGCGGLLTLLCHNDRMPTTQGMGGLFGYISDSRMRQILMPWNRGRVMAPRLIFVSIRKVDPQ